jgi:tetratricopeptide (TPR) repeat protein
VRKEALFTAITAIVFFAVGFLAGYIYDAQKRSAGQPNVAVAESPRPQVEAASSGAPAALAPPPATAFSGLPDGHPPVDAVAAVKMLKDEAARSPRDPQPRLRLANFFYDQKQYDKAIEWYRLGLELDPGDVNARTDLGTAYFYLGRPQEARREYQKSLEADPRHEPTLFNLVVINLDGTHDLKAAQEALDRLEGLNPNYAGLETLKQRLEAARSSGAPR